MRILVTGFEPFGGENINPSYEAVKLLPDRIGGAEIIKMEIPTVRRKSIDVLSDKIEEVWPDAVVSVGQAGGASAIRVERVAINIDDYRIPDNDGNQPSDEPVYSDGPNAYFSTLPIKKMRDAIQAKDTPIEISNSAGTFVCNHIFYGVRHLCETKYAGKGIISGFIHVPFIREQVVDKSDQPSMKLEDIAAGITAALEVIAESIGE
ncbi:MAG: pyroglutamyl-peptidase I [Firmicutes bacterium]|nr:pyroglutamyl-peptidase I [Bacillota bacterium]